VTRILSRENPEQVIVTRLDENVYVRRDRADIDLKPLIELGRSKGWNIGGKHEVCGIVDCTDSMLSEVVTYLERQLLT
jgi:hypothetical protein